MTSEDEPPGPVGVVRASTVLKVRAVWIAPVVVTSVLIFLMSLIYIGSVVDPISHLHGLPVLLVNEDAGAQIGSQNLNVGKEVSAALEGSSAVTSKLTLTPVTLTEAKKRMDKGSDYATVVMPPNLTSSVVALSKTTGSAGSASGVSPATAAPIQLLTNPRAGSIGVGLASGVLTPAVSQISQGVAQRLSALNPGAAAHGSSAGPLVLTQAIYRPLPARSALGLSAFYISLLTIMCGFLGGTLINSTVDSALGYATTEIGPKWSQRLPLPINRWQTLLAKWAMSLVVVPILTAIMLAVSAGILNMDAPHLWLLWLFASFAAIVVALGTLVLFAALGTLGQLAAILIFVYLALASSGGTIPLQALPGWLKFAAGFEPLRQILGGVRAILYFDAVGEAGLTRGFVLTIVGLVLWVVLGALITTWYDHRKLYRMSPDLMAYVHRSVETYNERKEATEAGSTTAAISGNT